MDYKQYKHILKFMDDEGTGNLENYFKGLMREIQIMERNIIYNIDQIKTANMKGQINVYLIKINEPTFILDRKKNQINFMKQDKITNKLRFDINNAQHYMSESIDILEDLYKKAEFINYYTYDEHLKKIKQFTDDEKLL